MKRRGYHEPDENGENSTIKNEETDAAASVCVPLK